MKDTLWFAATGEQALVRFSSCVAVAAIHNEVDVHLSVIGSRNALPKCNRQKIPCPKSKEKSGPKAAEILSLFAFWHILWQVFLKHLLIIKIPLLGHMLKNIHQIITCINFIRSAGFHNGVGRCNGFCSFRRFAEQLVLLVDGKRSLFFRAGLPALIGTAEISFVILIPLPQL